MVENGYYKIKQEYIDLVRQLGGKYSDSKERPLFCCLKDSDNHNIFWAIPTSSIKNRSEQSFRRIQEYCSLPERNLRSAFYHIGHTNIKAIFRVSNVLPITEKYISAEYTSHGSHLIARDQALILQLRKKLGLILITEKKHPNYFEQHITNIKNALINELLIAQESDAPSQSKPQTADHDVSTSTIKERLSNAKEAANSINNRADYTIKKDPSR